MISARISMLGVMLGTAAACAAAQPANGLCDEACLKGFMDLYLDGLAHHDPARVPTSAHYRFTENGAQIPLGEALWITFSSFGKYRHDVADPETGGIASYLSIVENKELPFPDLLAVRLKVVDRKITEIETVITRHARSADNMPPKDPSWMDTMNRIEPERERRSREELQKGALGYLRAVAFHDGSLAPFADSCIRLENGGLTALGPDDVQPVPKMEMPPAPNGAPAAPSFFLLGSGCGKQLAFKSYTFITGYEDARFPIVDVKRQIVYAVFDFMRRGNVESWTFEGRQVPFPEGMRYPNEILNTEMFKFVDGKITRVEAVFEGPQTYMRGTGWPGGTKPESRPIGE